MKLIFVFTLCLSVGVTFGSDDVINKTTKPSTTPVTPTTSSTTASPPSTTEPPTTSTQAPTTPSSTAPTPTTSSPPPTSSPTTPSTSTVPPSSSTTPAPHAKWVVVDPKSNVTCIVAEMEVTFNLHSGKTPYSIEVNPANAKAVGGHCGPTNQLLNVIWEINNLTSSMALTFTKSKTDYYISGFDLSLAHNTTTGFVVSNFSAVNLTISKTNVNTSYYCESVDMPELKNSNNETVDTTMKRFSVEAFKSDDKTVSTIHYCSGEIPDIVPLVVGIALAALVLVVVIAYLIGRRRSQARGYLSM